MPTTPQKVDGLRIDPEVSPPVATVTMPAASAAAEPLLEPPGVRARFHGLCASGNAPPDPALPKENSGRCVFPTSTAPACFKRVTTVASKPGTKSTSTGVLAVVRMPVV
jgi:hypothetical protein